MLDEANNCPNCGSGDIMWKLGITKTFQKCNECKSEFQVYFKKKE